jgi:hypothetical protein
MYLFVFPFTDFWHRPAKQKEVVDAFPKRVLA